MTRAEWPRPRRSVIVLLLVSATLLAALVGAIFAPQGYSLSVSELSALSALLVGISLLAFARLRTVLGRYTAVAAISLVWAGLAYIFAMASPNCPGGIAGGPSCTQSEALTQAGVALLMPVLPVVAIVPAVLSWRSLRSLYRFFRKARAGSSEATDEGTSVPRDQAKRGRTTPKGTVATTPTRPTRKKKNKPRTK